MHSCRHLLRGVTGAPAGGVRHEMYESRRKQNAVQHATTSVQLVPTCWMRTWMRSGRLWEVQLPQPSREG